MKKIFDIKECDHSCPLHSRCAYDDEGCFYYEENPDIAMNKKDKKPKFCRVKRVIVEELV